MEQGFVQVYTGNGKGKTTAALGLVLRAAGAGLSVYLGQFMKQGDYSEIRSLDRLPEVKAEQFGTGKFVMGKPGPEDMQCAARGFEAVERAVMSGQYDLVVADEILVAVRTGLVEEDRVLDLMAKRPGTTELVLTGRGATERIMAAADLVSELTEIKHYYKAGVKARTGIEK